MGSLRRAEHFYEVMITFMMLLLRTGDYKGAAELASAFASTLDSDTPLPGSRVERIGARRILSYILELGSVDVPVDFWEGFDPYDVPHTDPR